MSHSMKNNQKISFVAKTAFNADIHASNELVTYHHAGVNLQANKALISYIKNLQRKNLNSSNHTLYHKPLAGKIDFAALMDISFIKHYRQPLLVTAADGVGTKLHLAQLFNYHKTVGVDLVAMCVNDLLCSGAKPLQFLDYIACGKLDHRQIRPVIASIVKGCELAGCVLAGGETAEHPKLMPAQQYDLAGFALGVVEKSKLIDGRKLKIGDVILGLPSSGVHSNGFSLIRKLYLRESLHLPDDSADRDFLKRILNQATVIYEPVLRPLLQQKLPIHALAHITGGGFFENIPRVLNEKLAVKIDTSAWRIPQVFLRIAKRANLPQKEMFSTFNMGIGMVVFVQRKKASYVLDQLSRSWRKNYPKIKTLPMMLGEVIPRTKKSGSLLFD